MFDQVIRKGQFRVSASQINRFIKEPLLWCIDQFFDIRDDLPSAYMLRGTFIGDVLEKAAVEALLPDLNPLVIKWTKTIQENNLDFSSCAFSKFIEPMLMQGLDFVLSKTFTNPRVQVETEGQIAGSPFLGYVDLLWDGGFIDFKCRGKKTEGISQEDMIQLAIYNHIHQRQGWICEVTPKGVELKAINKEQCAQAFAIACSAVGSMRAMYEAQGSYPEIFKHGIIGCPIRDINGNHWSPNSKALALKFMAMAAA